MKTTIKVGDKIGYLRPNTGKYEYAEIVHIYGDCLTLLSIFKVGNKKLDNVFTEQLPNVLKWLNEESPDWKDGRKLLKHRSISANYMSEAANRYTNYLAN